MAKYDINFTDATKSPIEVESDTEVVTGLDLALFGRGFLEFGEELNANLLRLLENFACPESSYGVPNTAVVNDNMLTEPVQGQLWYNSTRKAFFQYNGESWQRISSDTDYAAQWGQISHAHTLPPPVSRDGYQFSMDECIWIVAPAGITGRFDYQYCSTSDTGVVRCVYHLVGNGNVLTEGVANYLIIGIRGRNHSATNNYGSVVLPTFAVPTPTPSPTPSVTPTLGVSPTPTPTTSPTPSPSRVIPTPTGTATPTPSKTKTIPTPTPTRSPTPTPSGAVPLEAYMFDSQRGGPFTDFLSICNIDFYDNGTLDYGYTNCSSTFGNCPSGACAPEPGNLTQWENGLGPELGVTVSGGVAPYTLRVKNVTRASTSTFPASGDCLYFASGAPFSTFPSGVVYSQAIATNGGTVSGLFFKSKCGTTEINWTGNVTVEVVDSVGHTVSQTFPWRVARINTNDGGGAGCVVTESFLPMGGTAGEVKVGDQLVLNSGEGEDTYGTVSYSQPEEQPCVRVVTTSGASLVCSTTAPLMVKGGEFVLAPNVQGFEVAVKRDGEQTWEEVASVTDEGAKTVQKITVGDRCFWAGEQDGVYILHHNAKQIDP